jgi:hypothetical protein
MFFDNSDNVGIGPKTPRTRLDVNGSFMAHNATLAGSLSATSANISGTLSANTLNVQTTTTTGTLAVNGAMSAASANITGKVNIGTTTSAINLDVKGIIRAEEVKVCLNQGCDYVFEDDYELMSLSDLNTFIKTNKHLPEIAPAAEMEAEGINLSEMNALLLKKVEELTLYIISMEKRLSEVESKKGGE